MNSAAAICGLGLTDMGRVYRSAEDLAAEAVYLALEDAGLPKSELDGLLINAGVTDGVSIPLHITLGLRELNVLTYMQGYGSSAGQMVQYAAMAVANAANEVAVAAFLAESVGFGSIPMIIEETLARVSPVEPATLAVVEQADSEARAVASELVAGSDGDVIRNKG